MHAALRKILGMHVAQKGSLVNNEHLRFDFSHFTKMTDEEIANVEIQVNEKNKGKYSGSNKIYAKKRCACIGCNGLIW